MGRDELLDEFDEAFADSMDPTGLTVLLSGQRGMGKTVLLDAYRHAAETDGWLVITESSSSGLLDRLTRDHLPRLLQQDSGNPPIQLESADLEVGPVGAGGSWTDRYPAESTLRSQVTELTDALAPRGSGLVLSIDEIQAADVEELRKLGEIVQYARREARPFAFAAAGLSTPIEELLDHEGTTFLRRADHHNVGRVDRPDVRTAIAQTIADGGREIDAQALDRAANTIEGYPFKIQLVGYHSVRNQKDGGPVTGAAEAVGIDAARRRVGRHVHTPALRPLSPVDRTYLLAMAQDDGPSRTRVVAERMGVPVTQYAGEYRRRLIRDGIIEPAGHGFVRFTIPYTGDHVREHAAHDTLGDMNDTESADSP